MMVDVFSPDKRRDIMSRIKGKNTTPEKIVRKCLYKLGFRFRLHRKDLPGIPDIVLPKYRTVIFVHGCFWHGHKGCPRSKRPSSNVNFWNEKLEKNITRDQNHAAELKQLGWRVLVIWECELKNLDELSKKLTGFLNAGQK